MSAAVRVEPLSIPACADLSISGAWIPGRPRSPISPPTRAPTLNAPWLPLPGLNSATLYDGACWGRIGNGSPAQLPHRHGFAFDRLDTNARPAAKRIFVARAVCVCGSQLRDIVRIARPSFSIVSCTKDKKMRLLIVEDDAALARGIIKVLRDDGLAIDHVTTGEDALAVLKTEPYSAVILDLGLPDMDGLSVLRQARQANLTVPILILTARDGTLDRVHGLNKGADDYLAKPFAIQELEARVFALIRRGQGKPEPTLMLGTFRLDRATGAAYIGDQILELTPRERAVLETLVIKSGSVVPKTRLSTDVFGFDAVAPNALEVHIARLRRKLENSGIEIVTVRGLGYLLRLA